MQIHVTRACDLGCFNCTQGSNLGGKPVMMTPEQFEEVCKAVKGYFGVVGVFGGNPCLSPHFADICKIMRGQIPWEQRGLWSNHPRGKGSHCRVTFNPRYSNLNVHLVRDAYDEFSRDWPECVPFLKGLDPDWPEAKSITNRDERSRRVGDARHSPPWVAMQDVDVLPDGNGGTMENTEENRWKLIAGCDVNQLWSSLFGVFRGELRFWFCELAAAQAMLHQNDPNWPDTGLPVTPGVWNQPMSAFEHQARFHCHRCGIPLRGYGELAIGGTTEQVSESHADIYKPKSKGREVQLVTLQSQLGKPLERATDYIQNSGNK